MEELRSTSDLHDNISPTIVIDTASIPDRVRDDLAAATLRFIHGILRKPGGREMLDARTAARMSAQATQQQSERTYLTRPEEPD